MYKAIATLLSDRFSGNSTGLSCGVSDDIKRIFFRKLLQCVFDKPHLLYFSIIYTVY